MSQIRTWWARITRRAHAPIPGVDLGWSLLERWAFYVLFIFPLFIGGIVAVIAMAFVGFNLLFAWCAAIALLVAICYIREGIVRWRRRYRPSPSRGGRIHK